MCTTYSKREGKRAIGAVACCLRKHNNIIILPEVYTHKCRHILIYCEAFKDPFTKGCFFLRDPFTKGCFFLRGPFTKGCCFLRDPLHEGVFLSEGPLHEGVFLSEGPLRGRGVSF